MTRLLKIAFVNEFADLNSPVTKLVHDFAKSFHSNSNVAVTHLSLNVKYRPGGTRWQRIASMFVLHLIAPFFLAFQWTEARFKKSQLCVVVTTSPPVLHWTVLIVSKIFNIRTMVWYQDAHPELEIRIFKRRNLNFLAKILDACDQKILPLADKIVTLDRAMADLLTQKKHVFPSKIVIAPPWTAFASPSKKLRMPIISGSNKIRLIYAGNFGIAHDLSPFAKYLSSLSTHDRKRISVTGIGMNESSRLAFTKIFQDVGLDVNTIKRTESFSELLAMFDNFDFGIVSLNADYAGLAAPSKAYTYVSQGLPILYIGPKRTLPDDLVLKGFGITLGDFKNSFSAGHPLILGASGTCLDDPKTQSIDEMTRAIYV